MKKEWLLVFLAVFLTFTTYGQEVKSSPEIEEVTVLDFLQIPAGTIRKYWLHLIDNGLSQPVQVPVIIAKGNMEGPVLGLTAAIHGNELNGIAVIQSVFEQIEVQSLKGTLVGVPGVNMPGMLNEERTFNDLTDLNRIFPGKADGNESEQYVYNLFHKIIQNFDFLIDMHTASFGRVNAMYVRADMQDDTLAHIARLQHADIILNNPGTPSAGNSTGGRTLRAEAVQAGIPTLTLEYGNPQVYQEAMIQKGVLGVLNSLHFLGMMAQPIEKQEKPAVLCNKSYWIYTDAGGLLEVFPTLAQKVLKGEKIAVLKNPFGDILKTYFAPEDGIIIGKSSNPVTQSGGRILHLGILASP